MANIPRPVNAKTIAFDKPGAGLMGYGITPENIGPKLLKLYGKRTDEAGGSKGVWDAMVKNTGKSLARSNSPVTREFKAFLDTGKYPDKPSAAFLRFAGGSLDYGLREVGRAQQHKKGFLDTFLGRIVTLGAEVAAAWVGGPWAAAAIGGGLGYVKDHDLFGALMGGIEGYGVGSLTTWAKGGGFTNLLKPANGAGITATGGGTGLSNVLTNIGTGAVSALSPGSLVGPAVSLAGAGAAAVAVGKIPRTTTGKGSTSLPPVVDAAPKTGPIRDKTMRAQVGDIRIARKQSLLAAGAHTGAGDPRQLTNLAPTARGGVIPIRTSVPNATPVARTSTRNGQTTIQMVA